MANTATMYAERFANVNMLDDCDVTRVTTCGNSASFRFDDAEYEYVVTVKRARKVTD